MPFAKVPVEWNGKAFESIYAMSRALKIHDTTLSMYLSQGRKLRGYLIIRKPIDG